MKEGLESEGGLMGKKKGSLVINLFRSVPKILKGEKKT